LIRLKLPKVDASPAAEQRESAIVADLLKELIVLPARRGFRVSGDDFDVRQENNVLWISPLL
jgi:hypothetical protein